MREFRVVFTVLALFALYSKGYCNDGLGKDGFNYYKDITFIGGADSVIIVSQLNHNGVLYRTYSIQLSEQRAAFCYRPNDVGNAMGNPNNFFCLTKPIVNVTFTDYLRAGRADEIIPGASADQMIYFYRTPLQLYPGFLPAVEQEYRKRTGNAFKNHMLSKDIDEESIPENKRGSKTALSFMMGNKHGPFHNNNIEVPNEEFVLTPAE